MTANNNFNVMSQFADLSELESSDDDDTNPTKIKYNFTNPATLPVEDEHATEPKDIIHPTIPKNNNSKFDLSQFQDLSLLESSDEEQEIEQKQQSEQNLSPQKLPVAKPTKQRPNRAKTTLLRKKSPSKNMKRTMATSVVKSVIGVTSKINSIQNKKKSHKNGTEKEEKIDDLRLPYKSKPVKPVAKTVAKTVAYMCPFRKVLMFAMHLHLTGTILPKWMIAVLTLFNDSNLKSCHEAASLGKKQRKLFVDTVCNFSEPDNFIYVDTMESIEIKVKYSSWAMVTVKKEDTKYSELKSIEGHKLHTKITNNHLMINKGVYLFFNSEYKTEYLDFFLYSPDKQHILYSCDEYKSQQRAHIKKILALDYDVGNKYSEWFLSVYDAYLAHFDVNDCYELLAGNVKYWKDLILNKAAMSVQYIVDRTFVVKTQHSKRWIVDTQRDYCSYEDCSERFGVVTRKHHCRSCGDIFCKNHCVKTLYRRNEKLECLTQSMYYSEMASKSTAEEHIHWNERLIRICPDCKNKYSLFVDVAHKHHFMNCKCLKWNVNQIDFEKQWEIFKAKMDIQSNTM